MANALTMPAPGRARTATLVIVGPSDRLMEAASVAGNGDATGSLRIVFIWTEREPSTLPPRPDVVVVGGVPPEYANNAIAAVRLSSLPTVVWWRGGPPEGLDGVASLADRVVLDAGDPWPLWRLAPSLFDNTAITDLRWARLTRWRAAMAHFFDLPQVREAARSFKRLTIRGSDRAQCALLAGWLDASLGWNGSVAMDIVADDRGVPMAALSLEGEAGQIVLELLADGRCLHTAARLTSGDLGARVVSIGNQSLESLLAEELKVRSRDLAFERALQSVVRSP
jgi:glucose-6-phosphate dehydrogenase assembly protein OpcA